MAGAPAQAPQATLKPGFQSWQALTSTAAPTVAAASAGLPEVAMFIMFLSVTVLVVSCLLAAGAFVQMRNTPKHMPVEQQPMVVRLMFCCITQFGTLTSLSKRKESRVEPMPEGVCKAVDNIHVESVDELPQICYTLPHPVKYSPFVQHLKVQQIQPAALFEQLAVPPDMRFVSRKQRERVMNGGWTQATNGLNVPRRSSSQPPSAPGSARSSRKASSQPPSVPGSARSSRKPTPRPSVSSNASTAIKPSPRPTPRPSVSTNASSQAPSVHPSVVSAGSNAPTPPSLD